MSKIDTDESLISEDEILAEESDEDDHFTSLSVQRGGIRASIIPESDPESDEENGHVQSPVETVRRKRIMVLESSKDSDGHEQEAEDEDEEEEIFHSEEENDADGAIYVSPKKSFSFKDEGIIEIVDSSDENHSESASSSKEDSLTEPELKQLLEVYKGELTKMEKLYKSANLNSLPDRGKKLQESIAQKTKDIQHLRKRLNLPDSSSDVIVVKSEISAVSEYSDTSYDPSNEPDSFEDIPKIKNEPRIKEEPRIKDDPFGKDKNLAFLPKPTAESDINNFGRKAQQTFENQQALTMERLESLHGSIQSQPKETDLADDPKGLKVSLMQHQKYALKWLSWRENQNPRGGILADDMGLGKTLTMISLILRSKWENQEEDEESDDEEIHARRLKYYGGTLIVCPASLIQQWDGEIANRVKRNTLNVHVFHGSNRTAKAKKLAREEVVITTYDTVSSESKKVSSPLFEIRWDRVILDEAHVIRNHKSQKSVAACELSAKNRWALTGTPIQNKALDLYAIMKFLRVRPFDDLRVWKRWVDNKNEAGSKRLSTVMSAILLRRTKKELQEAGTMETMPEKIIDTIDIELNPSERIVYQKLLLYSQTLFAQFLHQQAEKKHMFELGVNYFDRPGNYSKDTQFNKAQKRLLKMHGTDVKSHEILVLLLRLRQVCCHPSLIHAMLDREDMETNGDVVDEAGNDMDLMAKLQNLNLEKSEPDLNESLGVDEAVQQNVLTSDNPIFNSETISSKVSKALDIIKEVMEKDEKLVIISQWTSYLEIFVKYLDELGFSYERFTGQVPVKKRQDILERFGKRNRDPRILLLSLTTGGVGLNLISANNLMILDIHWNPQLELQAHDRVYRVGQDKEVKIYRLLCKDTIEERVQKLQEKKLEEAANLLEGKKVSSKLTIEDLKSLFSL